MQYQDQKFFALKFLNHFTNAARFSVQLRVRAPAFRGVGFVRNQKESCRTPGEQAGRGHERIGTLPARARARWLRNVLLPKRPRHPLLSPYAQTTHAHVAAGAVASVLCYGLGCAVFSLVALMRWLHELPLPAVPAESQQMQPASLTPFAHSVCCRVLHHWVTWILSPQGLLSLTPTPFPLSFCPLSLLPATLPIDPSFPKRRTK